MKSVMVRVLQSRPPFTWLVAACLTTIGCDTPTLRLEVERDTLVLYGDHFTPLPVKAIDARGVASPAVKATITRADASALAVSGSWVSCLRPGGVRVSLSAKGVAGSIVVDCRAIRAFHPPPDIEMDVNDEPHELKAAVTLASGEVVRVEPVGLTIGDSTVVSIEGNHVTPLAVGYTSLKINYGGVVATTTARVRETTRQWTAGVEGRRVASVGPVRGALRYSRHRQQSAGPHVATDGNRRRSVFAQFPQRAPDPLPGP